MAAIAAVVDLRLGRPIEAREIESMLRAMTHRAPDGWRAQTLGAVGLGHGAFRTTDFAGAAGAVTNRRGDCWLAGDLRLDNRDELRAELGLEAEASDEAIALAAYERWGERSPKRLLGDFAFVVWDAAARRLFAARDPFGVRPFYYHHDGRTFSCASDFVGLFALGHVPRRPDRLAAGLFVANMHFEFDRTLYEGIHPLPPAHALSVQDETVRVFPYWQPDPFARIECKSSDEYAERFGDVFSEAVKCRLVANRTVASTVSGGLDSSSVACLAERLRSEGRVAGDPIHLYRVAFPGIACDEREFSQSVADRWNLPLTTLFPLDDLELCNPRRALPPDVYLFPTLLMMESLRDAVAEDGSRVLLFGCSAELVQTRTGFEPVDAWRAGNLRAAGRAVGLDREPRSRSRWAELARAGVTAFLPKLVRSAARRRYRFRVRALAPTILEEMVDFRARSLDARDARPSPDLVTREVCSWVMSGPGQLFPLTQIDRFHAHAGVEARHPFLDRRLVELLLAIPPEQRVTRWRCKLLQRRAMRGTLPDGIVERDSAAEFTCYCDRAFTEPYRREIETLLTGGRLVEQGIVDARKLANLLGAPRDLRAIDEISNLTALELWLRHLAQ